jgi:hypothetical protein
MTPTESSKDGNRKDITNKVIANISPAGTDNINNREIPYSNRNHKSMPSASSSSLVQEIRHSSFHDHNMLIYPDLTTYREVYSESAKQALDDNETVLLITTYDSFDKIKDSMMQVGISVNNESREGNLIILDAAKAYQIDTYGAVKFVTTLAKQVERDEKAGVFALTEMGSFFIAERIATLLEYEQSLQKRFDIRLKGTCTYHKDDFAGLSKEEQDILISAHNRVVV